MIIWFLSGELILNRLVGTQEKYIAVGVMLVPIMAKRRPLERCCDSLVTTEDHLHPKGMSSVLYTRCPRRDSRTPEGESPSPGLLDSFERVPQSWTPGAKIQSPTVYTVFPRTVDSISQDLESHSVPCLATVSAPCLRS